MPAPRPPARPSRAVAPRVRAARLGDVPALVALEQRSFTTDRVSARQFRHHLGRGHSWLAVATIDGALVGDVLVFFRRGSAVARLYSLVVDAAARGRGVGGALLARAEREARRRGCAAMTLEVRTDNAAATMLYERHGYVRLGTRARYYEDGADAYRYRKTWVVARDRRAMD